MLSITGQVLRTTVQRSDAWLSCAWSRCERRKLTPCRNQQPLHLARAKAMPATNDRERLPCSTRRNDLVLDDQGDGIGILAGELKTLDQVVERCPMDTELRG